MRSFLTIVAATFGALAASALSADKLFGPFADSDTLFGVTLVGILSVFISVLTAIGAIGLPDRPIE